MSLSAETGVQGMTTAKKINALLNSPKTRNEGLQVLSSYLSYCTDEEIQSSCVGWMQNCCKMDASTNIEFAVNVLRTLFKISWKFQELKKPVSFFITSRYFDYFFKHLLKSEPGWLCTETCLSLYRGSCGPFREILEKHLESLLGDSKKISSTICRCYALVPCMGGGGMDNSNYRKNWKIQFRKFLSDSHSILNELFSEIEEFQEFKIPDHVNGEERNDNSPESLQIQFENNINILCSMLLNSYPAPKSIPSDSVFELICRGLAITPKALAGRQTTHLMAVEKVLPHVHRSLFSLLTALVSSAKSQLLPYSRLITKLVKQSLDWTVDSAEDSHCYLRITSYEALCNWFVVARHGASVELELVSHAVQDVKPKKESIRLKEGKVQSFTKSRRVEASANRSLCYAALKTLQYLLRSAGVSLNPEHHKLLQELAVSLLVEVQKSVDVFPPFDASACRKELYSLLLELVLHPAPEWPPPTNFALRLFRKGENDPAPEVSAFCFGALTSLTVVIHPQYDNGGFPNAEDTQEAATRERMDVEFEDEKDERKNAENGEDTVEEEEDERKDAETSFEMEEDANKIAENGEDTVEEEEDERKDAENGEDTVEEEEDERKDAENEESIESVQNTEKEKTIDSIKGTGVSTKESEVSSDEDSKNTVTFWEIDTNITEETKPIAEESPIIAKNGDTDEEPEAKKRKATEDKPKQTPSKKEEHKTIATTPETTKEEVQARVRYNLRSKTKASSEEPEERSKTTKTPGKTPLKPKRPRTRASSRASETESSSPDKTIRESSTPEDEEDIKSSFCDSFIN